MNVFRWAYGSHMVVQHWHVKNSAWPPLHSDDVLISIMMCVLMYISVFVHLFSFIKYTSNLKIAVDN